MYTDGYRWWSRFFKSKKLGNWVNYIWEVVSSEMLYFVGGQRLVWIDNKHYFNLSLIASVGSHNSSPCHGSHLPMYPHNPFIQPPHISFHAHLKTWFGVDLTNNKSRDLCQPFRQRGEPCHMWCQNFKSDALSQSKRTFSQRMMGKENSGRWAVMKYAWESNWRWHSKVLIVVYYGRSILYTTLLLYHYN